MSAATALLPRQEAYCRHVASGRSLAGAARLAGYAWDSAKQHGSRLLRDPRIAARVVELAAAREVQRQAELDWVVARAKRAVESALAKGQEGTVLRGLDRVVAFQGLMDGPLGRVSDLDLADPDEAEEDGAEEGGAGEGAPQEACSDEAAPPSMPPERPAPVEPSPDPRVAAEQAHAEYILQLREEARARLAALRARTDPGPPTGVRFREDGSEASRLEPDPVLSRPRPPGRNDDLS